MNAMRAQRWIGLVLALASIAAYCLADGNLVLFVLSVPGAIAGWVLTMPPVGRPLPRLAINVILLAILAYTLLALSTRGFHVSAVCEIITLILLAKILDRRSQRDQGQVVSISGFLCIGTILTSNSLAVGLMLMLCLLLLAGATVVHQIGRHVEIAPGVMPTRTVVGKKYQRHLRRLVVLCTLAGLVISVVVFTFIPRRLGAGLFGSWGNAALGQVTGFVDEVELGTPGLISQSSQPVLDLQVTDAQGTALGGTGMVYYLRGAVLDAYERGRWTRSEANSERGLRQRTDHLLSPMLIADEPRRWNLAQRITIRNVSGARSHLFSVYKPVRLHAHQPTAIYSSPDGTIVRESEAGKFEYTVYSLSVEPRLRYAGRQGWGEVRAVEAENLNGDRFAEYARGILQRAGIALDASARDAEDIERASRAIVQSFLDGFMYSLEAEPVPRRRDPTEWFLFERREGHCEYYASAMAILCRSVGINARVITGYVATEFNEATGHYLVRQSNAHAWVETEVGPGVWKTFDPTPPADFARVHEPSQSVAARVRRWADAIEFAWIRAVVSYDAEKQTSFMRSAFGLNWSPNESMEDLADDFIRREPREVARLVGVVMMVLAAIGLAVVGAYLMRKRLAAWLRAAMDRLSLAQGRGVMGLYARFLAGLSRRGMPRPDGLPLLTHVRTHAHMLSDASAVEAEGIARALYRLRFGAADEVLLEATRERIEAFSKTDMVR